MNRQINNMNRQIRFRVYNTKQNKWVHGPGNEVDLFGETILLGGFMQKVPTLELNDCVALQYIGLTDSNGKDIYEGDIIEFPNNIDAYRISFIKFNNGSFYVHYPDHNYELIASSLSNGWYMKVIGNIFENKELLK